MTAALLLAGVAWASMAAAAGDARCPDVSGRYSVTGLGPGLSDAMVAMEAEDANYLDSGVELSGAVDGTLSVWVKSGRLGSWSTRPAAVLRLGTDFECDNGRLIFTAPVANTTRKTSEGAWYRGESRASLSRLSNGELSIGVRFTGSQQISLYSYDSANVSIPRPGTRTTLLDSYRWPVYSDTDSRTPEPVAEPAIVRATRARLTPQVLGNMMLVGLHPNADGALATLKAMRSDHVAAFEDRLRAASILFEMKVAPTWSGNTLHMELLIRPAGTVSAIGSQPSVFRIEQELERTLPALIGIDSVTAADNGYLVTLTIIDPQPTIPYILAIVQANSTLIDSVELLDEAPRTSVLQARVVQLKLQVR